MMQGSCRDPAAPFFCLDSTARKAGFKEMCKKAVLMTPLRCYCFQVIAKEISFYEPAFIFIPSSTSLCFML